MKSPKSKQTAKPNKQTKKEEKRPHNPRVPLGSSQAGEFRASSLHGEKNVLKN